MKLRDYMVKTECVLKVYEEKPFSVFGFIAEYLNIVEIEQTSELFEVIENEISYYCSATPKNKREWKDLIEKREKVKEIFSPLSKDGEFGFLDGNEDSPITQEVLRLYHFILHEGLN